MIFNHAKYTFVEGVVHADRSPGVVFITANIGRFQPKTKHSQRRLNTSADQVLVSEAHGCELIITAGYIGEQLEKYSRILGFAIGTKDNAHIDLAKLTHGLLKAYRIDSDSVLGI